MGLRIQQRGRKGSLEEFITPRKHLQKFPGNEEAIRPVPSKKGKEWTGREYEGNGLQVEIVAGPWVWSMGTVASSDGLVFGPRTGK